MIKKTEFVDVEKCLFTLKRHFYIFLILFLENKIKLIEKVDSTYILIKK